jgi:hypothetical protein
LFKKVNSAIAGIWSGNVSRQHCEKDTCRSVYDAKPGILWIYPLVN